MFYSFNISSHLINVFIFPGLNDRAMEAGYTWSDGSPVTFINWWPGEPSDDKYEENCVEMYPGSFQWNDRKCSETRGYICKQPLGKVYF